MKKVLPFALLITVMLASSGAGCGGKKSGDPEPEQFNGLLGRWELKEAEVYAQDVGQSERMLGKSGEGLAFVFYADGKYDGCFLPGSEWTILAWAVSQAAGIVRQTSRAGGR
ncbi:MAG: hypothetical protein BGO21_02215 [Dyadobacter sp. 50-39]|uniref:hypothetical protein n=1 Tax=Dyadobacter sp. 50-39 TaxID=1895756 RepID=UPI0009673576|nr:hypothetical protein [Dyadobacter sp. 50-39]OJV12584.1 MAG: hypothetical protein BGO21_02215 [Dyadobacter sp. 50-39]